MSKSNILKTEIVKINSKKEFASYFGETRVLPKLSFPFFADQYERDISDDTGPGGSCDEYFFKVPQDVTDETSFVKGYAFANKKTYHKKT